MNVLILGGTRFVGRHLVEALTQNGHRVVCFHRGQTQCLLPDGVEERLGDRNEDLSGADTERWDAIVDTSGQRPEQVARSLQLRTERYLFVSTVNVYRDLSVAGVTEEAATIAAFDQSDEDVSYGGNKAACERLVLQRYPATGVVLRPGLIAGKWDYTGRVTYWCERFLQGGNVLAPGDPDRLVQFIDGADLARFAAHVLSNGIAGTFNIMGPEVPTTMAEFLAVCGSVAAERGARAATITWADKRFLFDNGVEEWLEMPLWVVDPRYDGILQMSNLKALAAGLQTRPIAQTVRAALDWREEASNVKTAGISQQREAELLAKLM